MINFLRISAEIKNLYEDIKKDFSHRPSAESSTVLINGLAKSGTSLFEHIISELGYVDGARSLLRSRYKCPRYKEGFICPELFESFPQSKKTYIKTHSVYQRDFQYPVDVKKLIVLRDIRDALVSRYYHIISEPKHWDYNRLRQIDSHLARFKASVFINNPTWGVTQFEYYAMFVDSWINSPFLNDIIWYEDYLNDPIQVISNIKAKLKTGFSSALELESKLEEKRNSMRKNISDLGKARQSSTAQSATYRAGKSGSYISFFDDELSDFYNDLAKKYRLEI